MGNWQSQQPVRGSRLCDSLEHSTVVIRTSGVVNNLSLCPPTQGFGQLGLPFARTKSGPSKSAASKSWRRAQ
eukprot:jgi/Botrbrau1/9646/Bobra.0131s0022.1